MERNTFIPGFRFSLFHSSIESIKIRWLIYLLLAEVVILDVRVSACKTQILDVCRANLNKDARWIPSAKKKNK